MSDRVSDNDTLDRDMLTDGRSIDRVATRGENDVPSRPLQSLSGNADGPREQTRSQPHWQSRPQDPLGLVAPILADLDRRIRDRAPNGYTGSHTCYKLAKTFDFDLVWIGEPLGDGQIDLRAAGGSAEPVADSLSRLSRRGLDQDPVKIALMTGEPQLWRKDSDGESAWATLSIRAGFTESVSLPMTHGGRTLSVLTAHSTRPGLITPAIVDALTPIASRLGLILSACRSESQMRLQSMALMAAANGIVITDRDGCIDWVNDGFVALTGYEAEEIVGRTPHVLNAGIQDPAFYESLWSTIGSGNVWRGEIVNRRKDGTLITVRETITPVKDRGGAVSHFIAVQEDVTAFRDAEERSAYFMAHDVLTGLPNRALMRDRLQQTLLRAERSGLSAVLILVDIDQFRVVNETHGHRIGDSLILAVGNAIQDCLRRSDTVARFGADEFAAILADIGGPADALTLAARVQEAISQIERIEGLPIRVSASIGAAVFPSDGAEPDTLIQSAELALRTAKSDRPQIKFFSRRLSEEIRARSSLRQDLAEALKCGEFFLSFQPQVDLRRGCVSGLEALVRWRSPSRGLVPPSEFIPIAEESGLIIDLGAWVIDEACRQLACWQRQGLHGLRIAINISTVQIRHGQLLSQVKESLAFHDVSAENLEFELTESVLLNESTQVARQLTELRAMGIRWAVDDFGTGYSSLGYLRRFPINKLKIDQSFIFGMIEDDNDMAIVRSVIGLAKNLNLKVVAEGVETPQHVALLRDFDCDEIQGYVFSRPLLPDAIPGKLNETLEYALAS